MTGVYIHIPFCKSRCAYCDFYSTTLMAQRGGYVDALIEEWQQRKHEVADYVGTLYIGGGTPSTLAAEDIARLIRAIGIEQAQEVTMECNPGDANESYLEAIRRAGVNRLSIGIQTLDDGLLRRIGRRHTAEEAREAVRLARQAGIDNLSVDLIYGLPGQTMAMWEQDIDEVLGLGVEHVSCYGLMYEEGTRLTRMLERGEIEEVDEQIQNNMYDRLCTRLKEAGYVHYEVSNWALPGREAVHNSNYWNGTPYIGLGAGAHSMTAGRREANPADLNLYIEKHPAREVEVLSDTDRYNEMVMLGLRTNKGINLDRIQCGTKCVQRYIDEGLLRREGDYVIATQQGLHILNRIITDLMI